MALVQGAFLLFPFALTGFSATSSAASTKRLKWSEASVSGLIHCKSSDVREKRLKREALVCVDRAVDGRLDSHSGVDSPLLKAESMDQLGYRLGDSEGAAPGAGVLGGENRLPRTLCNARSSKSLRLWITG